MRNTIDRNSVSGTRIPGGHLWAIPGKKARPRGSPQTGDEGCQARSRLTTTAVVSLPEGQTGVKSGGLRRAGSFPEAKKSRDRKRVAVQTSRSGWKRYEALSQNVQTGFSHKGEFFRATAW